MILTIYNGKSDIVFWQKFKSTTEKTHPRVTTQLINKHENKQCGNYYRHKILSKVVTLLYIITETVRFNYIYIRSSRRQVSTMRNTTLDKRFPSLNFRHPEESKGCLKFRLKDFPR